MAEQNINIEDLNEGTNTTEDTSVEDRNAAEANTEASDAKENDGSLVKDENKAPSRRKTLGHLRSNPRCNLYYIPLLFDDGTHPVGEYGADHHGA